MTDLGTLSGKDIVMVKQAARSDLEIMAVTYSRDEYCGMKTAILYIGRSFPKLPHDHFALRPISRHQRLTSTFGRRTTWFGSRGRRNFPPRICAGSIGDPSHPTR
jgi:hypothetical protein